VIHQPRCLLPKEIKQSASPLQIQIRTQTATHLLFPTLWFMSVLKKQCRPRFNVAWTSCNRFWHKMLGLVNQMGVNVNPALRAPFYEQDCVRVIVEAAAAANTDDAANVLESVECWRDFRKALSTVNATNVILSDEKFHQGIIHVRHHPIYITMLGCFK
jgi:hypothetical protein